MEAALSYNVTGLLGIHWRTKVVGPQIAAMAMKSWNIGLKSDEFWSDWATSSFGGTSAQSIAAIFAQVESFKTPRPVNWIGGPGGLQPDASQCNLDHTTYGFVDQLLSLADSVTGPAEMARYQYDEYS